MSCAKEKTPYKTAMNWSRWALNVIAICLVSCETAHEIGRAVTAPVRYVFKEPEPPPSTTTSDVSNPGQPVAVPSPTPTPRAASRKSNRPATPAKSGVAANKSSAKPSPSPQKSPSATQFQVPRPVPARPGPVFIPSNASAGYTDVGANAPGTKAK